MNQRLFHIVYVIILVGINLCLKGWNITYNAIALDEPFSIFHAQMPVSEIIATLQSGNNPPLYEIILHGWIKIFGIGAFAVRMPSLIFGTLAIVMIYLTGIRFLNRKAAVLASMLLTFSTAHLYYAGEARAYALFMFLFTASVYAVLKYRQENFSIKRSVVTSLWLALMAFTHYFGVFLGLLLLAIVGLTDEERTRGWKKAIVGAAILLALFGVYIPVLWGRILDTTAEGTWVMPVENLGNLHDVFFWLSNNSRMVYLAVMVALWGGVWMVVRRLRLSVVFKIVLLLLVVPGCFVVGYSVFFAMPFVWKLTSNDTFIWLFTGGIAVGWFIFYFMVSKKMWSGWLVVGSFLIPLLFIFGISFYIPVFNERYIAFLFPVGYLVLAMAFHALLKGTKVFLPAGLVLVVLFAYSFDMKRSNERDVHGLMEAVNSLRKEDTKIFLGPMQFKHTFLYHFNRSQFSDYKDLNEQLQSDRVYPVTGFREVEEDLNSGDKHILFIDANTATMYPANGIYEFLDHKYELTSVLNFEGNLRLYSFTNE